MPTVYPFVSDASLFYEIGIFGERGYGVPNFGKNATGESLNVDIERFTSEGGLRISMIMHQSDAIRVDPPSFNVLREIVLFINRARTLLVGRAVGENEPRMQGEKVRSARIPLRVFPCPFFHVDNRLMHDFCQAGFSCLAELFQSTENSLDYDISDKLSEVALRYIRRFQRDLAMDYFGMSKEAAEAADLDLSKHFDAYTPLIHGFVSAEAFDEVDTLSFPDATDLGILAKGILIMDLPPLGPYPYGSTGSSTRGSSSAGGSKTATSVPAFPDNPSYAV